MIVYEAKSLIQKELIKREIERRAKAKKSLLPFTQYTFPAYKTTWYHDVYSQILDNFASGKIKRLIISMPPQHGKSELSTRRLPAFLLGKNNTFKIGLASYNATKVREFSQDVQRVISDPLYHNIFPNTLMKSAEYLDSLDLKHVDAKKTQERFEVFDGLGIKRGDLKAVGRGGALTGNPIDIMIMDDLYKDYKEGNSPIIRKAVIDWYTSVVKTRFHNHSQELIVFTRWHEEDLIGYIEKESQVEIIKSFEQIENPDPDIWYKINFPSIQTRETQTEIDTREIGEALWAERHNLQKLEEYREMDREKFESLYQGDPRPMEGMLFQKPFATYRILPQLRYIRNYTDTADTGQDYLCSICYGVGIDDRMYILDLEYTTEPQEITEQTVADMLSRNKVVHADIESNNGGRAFARSVDRLSGYRHNIEWFHQSENKEARILSNASNLQRLVSFPENWEGRWPEFHKHITRFKRNFRANEHDDGLDALTGCLEFSGLVDENNMLWS